MDFILTPEQVAFRDTARAFLTQHCGISLVRDHLETDTAQPAAVWSSMTELGWHTLLVAESQGGLAAGTVAATQIAEVCGAALHGGPLVGTALLGAYALARCDADAVLKTFADTAPLISIALEENGAGNPVDRIATTATGRGESYRLNGTKTLVIDGHLADSLLVAARTSEGIRGFIVDPKDATVVATPTLDLTRKSATVTLRDTPAEPLDSAASDRNAWESINSFGALIFAAEMLGVAQAALDLAIDYAQTREVFDKPLSKFQVTRHKAVDILRDIELARVGVHAAALAHDDDPDAPSTAIAISMAKSAAAIAANHASAECIQLHGAMGYTWDCDAHLYLRRAKVNDVMFGNQSWHRQRVADSYLATF